MDEILASNQRIERRIASWTSVAIAGMGASLAGIVIPCSGQRRTSNM